MACDNYVKWFSEYGQSLRQISNLENYLVGLNRELNTLNNELSRIKENLSQTENASDMSNLNMSRYRY